MVTRTKQKIPAQATAVPRCHRRKPAIEEVRLADLRDHPDQGDYFGNRHDVDLPGLIASIRAEGLKHPIEILPAGNKAGLAGNTMLVGHRRKAALVALGHSVTKAIVRYDLLDADADTIRGLFIGDNLLRRQLHPLDKARAILGLIESKLARKVDPTNTLKVREEIGAALGVSGRHLLRVLRIITLPVPLQHAVRDGHVPMVLAEKVAALSKAVQAEVSKLVAEAATSKIKQIIAASLPAPQHRGKPPTQACYAFLQALRLHLPQIRGREHKIFRKLLHEHLPVLAEAQETIAALQEAAAKFDGTDPLTLLEKLAKDMEDIQNGKGAS